MNECDHVYLVLSKRNGYCYTPYRVCYKCAKGLDTYLNGGKR